MSLYLWGPSKTGKTMLARSFDTHAYFGGLFSLEEYEQDPDCSYAVFDDIQGGFKFFPAYKSWLGQQTEFYCTDRYRKKKHIAWGKPCIWLSNNDPMSEDVDHDWLEKNCIIVYVGERLYSPEPSCQ